MICCDKKKYHETLPTRLSTKHKLLNLDFLVKYKISEIVLIQYMRDILIVHKMI